MRPRYQSLPDTGGDALDEDLQILSSRRGHMAEHRCICASGSESQRSGPDKNEPLLWASDSIRVRISFDDTNKGGYEMAFSLYAATVPTYRQILGSVSLLLDKAEAFCVEKGLAQGDIIQACLAPDMLPFAYQVAATTTHSLGAVEGVRKGEFSPDMTPPPDSFAALKKRVTNALTAIEAIEPSQIDAFIGRDVTFAVPARNVRIDFTAENFLLSFSQPNFYFHATTTYDILRWKGVQIGKRDFIGSLRSKT